jgi:hypothetical protein
MLDSPIRYESSNGEVPNDEDDDDESEEEDEEPEEDEEEEGMYAAFISLALHSHTASCARNQC